MTTERHQLWLGDGRGGFTDASDQLPRRSQGNALAVGDLDGDGRPDVFIGGWATQARLLLSGPAPAR